MMWITMPFLARNFVKVFPWHSACRWSPVKPVVIKCNKAVLIEVHLKRGFCRHFSVYGYCEACFGHVMTPCLWEDIDGSGCESIASCAENVSFPQSTQDHSRNWDTVTMEEVLNFLRHIQQLPSIEDFIHILLKCRKDGILQHILKVHIHVCNIGLEANVVIGNILVQLFLDCTSLEESIKVFNKLLHPNEYSWTVLIQHYNDYGNSKYALHLFTAMHSKYVCRSKYTYVAGLKACAEEKSLKLAQQIHADVLNEELHMDPYIANSLIGVYSKCGLLPEARKIFQGLLAPSVVAWTALMAAYAEHGVAEEGLNCLDRMLLEGICPNAFTVACVLRMCATVGDLERGQHIHSVIAAIDEYCRDSYVGNALVDMYAKCGKLEAAQKVFKLLGARDTITWTALLTGFNIHGLGGDAVDHLEEMQVQGVPMNAVTFASSLKACALMRVPARGQVVHDEIVKAGFELDQVVGNALIDMYAKLGSLSEAQVVFEQLPARNAISWNILIAGYSEQGFDENALLCTQNLLLEGVCMDATSCISSFKACGNLKDLNKGCLLHFFIIEKRYDTDMFIGNSLVDMYTKCHAFPEAMHVFMHLSSRDVVAWTACISVYLAQGLVKEALFALENLQFEGVSPDEVAYVYGLQACGTIGALDFGRALHSQIVKHGLGSNLAVGNMLIDMYNKCHSLIDAYYLFVQFPSRTPASWSALIAGYTENDLCGEALLLVEQMEQEGLSPNYAAFASSLRACGTIGAVEKGRELHSEIVKKGLLLEPLIGLGEGGDERDASSLAIGNCLIDMYAKCKHLIEAQHVFNTIPKWSLETWNALMVGYTRMGEDQTVFHLFGRLNKEGISPNGVTFLSLLTACSHGGLVEKGDGCYINMSKEYGINPTIEHHNCMIDLMGRAGQLTYAVKLLEEMPSQPNMSSWNTILAACRKWGNVELARRALECAMRLDQNHAAAFISMYNIYADSNMWTDAKRIRAFGKRAKTR